MKYQFTTIIIKEGKWYVAKCAELGVVSQGRTEKEAEDNLKEAVELYLEDDQVLRKYILNVNVTIKTTKLNYV
jgi:predicted RNase H-like HicB family nuclease